MFVTGILVLFGVASELFLIQTDGVDPCGNMGGEQVIFGINKTIPAKNLV